MMNDEFEVRRGKTNFQFSTFDFQSKNRKAEAEFSLLPFRYTRKQDAFLVTKSNLIFRIISICFGLFVKMWVTVNKI